MAIGDPAPLPDDSPPPHAAATGGSAGATGEERRVANMRRALDRRVAAVLESVTHAFIALDADWRVAYANREAARLNRTTPEALLGGDHWTIWPETVGSEVERRYRQVVVDSVPAHFVHHYAIGGVWHEIHAYPSEGGLAVLYRDITEERRAEAERERLAAALAERERELAAVLENATDVVTRYDRGLRFIYANPAIEAATGLAVRDVIGRSCREVLAPNEAAAAWDAALMRVFTTGEAEEVGLEYMTPYGERHFESRLIPEWGPDDTVRTVLSLARDVTERVRAAAALATAFDGAEAARAEAEAANATKGQFLAKMSHELRTPLNAIRGYVDLLTIELYGPVNDAQRAALSRIGESERHLLDVITGILDYARLESGRARYEIVDVALDPLLSDAHALLEPQFRSKGLACDYERPVGGPVIVRADPGKVRQIVLNLLSNALKFTPPGGRVAVCCRSDRGCGVVEVVDTGPGVPADQLERVFEPFVQLDRGRGESVGGTGLGLAISRELARGMRGDLTAESTPGMGSTFRLTLSRS